MIRRSTLPRFAAALLALWLCGQLMAAFHIGHDDQESATTQVEQCLLCKVAHADDLALLSAASLALLLLTFLLLPAAEPSVAYSRALTQRARAPPAH